MRGDTPASRRSRGGWSLAIAAALSGVLGAACAPSGPTPAIARVVPAQAFTDGRIVLRADVENLRPALDLDLDLGTLQVDLQSVRMVLLPDPPDGRAAVPLAAFDWDRSGAFWMWAPPGIAAGDYALELTDPRGRRATLNDAFSALGNDPSPPVVTVVPALLDQSIVAAGTTEMFQVVADDGPGTVALIHWLTDSGVEGECPPIPGPGDAGSSGHPALPPSRLACPVSFTVPPLDDPNALTMPFGFHAWASDVAGNESPHLDLSLLVARLPTIRKFSGTAGALGGYQPFEVDGSDFLPGAQALLDGVPIIGTAPGGDLVGDQRIVGWTPPRNRAGPVSVQVRTPAGTAEGATFFSYLASPTPREVEPNHGSRAGGFRVTVRGNDLRTAATVFVGQTPDARLPLSYPRYDKSETKIDACMPAGSGTVSLWVYDALTGDGELARAFTYDDAVGGAPASIDPGCQ